MFICYENKMFSFSERQLIDLFLRNFPSYTTNFKTRFIECTYAPDEQSFTISGEDNESGDTVKVRFFIMATDEGYYLEMHDVYYGDWIDNIYLG